MPELVITAVGPDRPGLVDELTGFLTDARANIADARMVNLRGRFAVILLAEAGEDAAATIARDITAHGQTLGLTVSVASHDGKPARVSAGVPFKLRTYAMDQPGIVHRITHLLHRHGVNIEELQTRLEAGAHTGTPLFTMELRMTVPPEVAVKKLREDLEQLCDSLNCDVDLDPA